MFFYEKENDTNLVKLMTLMMLLIITTLFKYKYYEKYNQTCMPKYKCNNSATLLKREIYSNVLSIASKLFNMV